MSLGGGTWTPVEDFVWCGVCGCVFGPRTLHSCITSLNGRPVAVVIVGEQFGRRPESDQSLAINKSLHGLVHRTGVDPIELAHTFLNLRRGALWQGPPVASGRGEP